MSATISCRQESERSVYRLEGTFDRSSAWMLRDSIEREVMREILLDFSLVRDFSDLAVAILAHGVTRTTRRILFRGLRQHQLRIFRYCGVAIEEATAAEPASPAIGSTVAEVH